MAKQRKGGNRAGIQNLDRLKLGWNAATRYDQHPGTARTPWVLAGTP